MHILSKKSALAVHGVHLATRLVVATFLISAAGLPALAANRLSLSPADLRCEYRQQPLGIDALAPELSWTVTSEERGRKQSAYQVLISSSAEGLAKDVADLWDSGKILSSATAHVAYAGKRLGSAQRVFWKVRVWDERGRASAWSAPATWTMGLIDPSDLKARWISSGPEQTPRTGEREPLPLFRREFVVTRPIKRALVFVCGLGFYELHLNGRRVGDQVLDPGWTNYRKTCLYSTYDVTAQLSPGTNAFGIMLGNGMFNITGGRYVKFRGSFGSPKMILQMRLEYADGAATEVVSDASWRTAPGPIQFSCIYGGEDYDARREHQGWDRASFSDAAWEPATIVEGPGGNLVSQSSPPLKVIQIFKPVRITSPKPGVLVYDLGQNFSGWPQLSVSGPAGATVKLITGEVLDAQGLPSQRSSGSPVWFSYTLRGKGTETWHPRFSYSGFRYVQVEGAARSRAETGRDKAILKELQGCFVHSSARTVGQFSCSNELLNRIHNLIDRAIESNLQSVLTDCPHREKLGWLEVSHLLGPAIMFNYDVATLYQKICRDTRESQLPNGLVPDIAPEYTVFQRGFRDSPEWGSACVIDAWHLYQRYGDRRVLADQYDTMARYVAYLGSLAKDHIVSYGLGDWYDIGPGEPGESKLTTKGLTATAIYYQDLAILAETARLLDKKDDAERYAQLLAQVKHAFNRQFFHPDSNQYDRASQTANAMPLVLGLVEPQRRQAVLENLVQDVRAHANHVTAGDVGFRYLLLALAQGGRSDVIFDLNTRPDAPSYGSQLAQGATTLTEAWDANPNSSQNHCMLGHAEEWFYTDLAGIQPDPAQPGFGCVIIAPQPVGDLTWVKASYDSIRGRIVSEWEKKNGQFKLHLVIPANVTATVFLPAASADTITESSHALDKAVGVRLLRVEKGRAVLAVESGNYRFASTLQIP